MRRIVRLFPAAAVAVLAVVATAAAQTSYPMITHVTPVAVQRGTTAEVVVEGQMNFAGVYKVLFEGAGVQAEVVPVPPPPAPASPAGQPPAKPAPTRSVKLKLTVAADAPVGVREFRLASTLGVSSIGQLVVVDEPVVQEAGDNNTFEKANPVPVPCVVCGRLEAVEDVDTFKFRAEAGQHLTVEVLCARLQDKIHDLQEHADPMLTLHDVEGREVAANDDSYFADPMLSYTVQTAGEYFVRVRDARYHGDPRWAYAMLITSKPYVSHVYPMAGNPGQTVNVQAVGSAGLAQTHFPIKMPLQPGVHEVQLEYPNGRTNATAVVVSPLPQVTEQEPNDTFAQAQRVALPCGINGRIGTRGDLDYYLFRAAKGKTLRFEVKARRFGTPLRSTLDSVLDVFTPQGQLLASNDDTFGKDARILFTPPADGDFVVRVRDLNNKGGETAVYYLEADFARPDFSLKCDPDKAMIGPGSGMAWYVHVTRVDGFDGPVKVEVKGLPRGVSVNPLVIPPAMTQGLLVLTAAADAPRDAVNVEVIGTATLNRPNEKDEVLTRTAVPAQEIYMPGGGRSTYAVTMQTVAVTDPSDIRTVGVSRTEVVLKPGEEKRIEVALVRRPDYDKSVSLDVLLRHLGSVYGNPLPPGVTVVENKSKTLLGTTSTGHVVFRAAADAKPVDRVPVSVMANVSVNFVVKISYSSPVIWVTVTK